jgi:hypothetical protein
LNAIRKYGLQWPLNLNFIAPKNYRLFYFHIDRSKKFTQGPWPGPIERQLPSGPTGAQRSLTIGDYHQRLATGARRAWKVKKPDQGQRSPGQHKRRPIPAKAQERPKWAQFEAYQHKCLKRHKKPKSPYIRSHLSLSLLSGRVMLKRRLKP